MKAPVSLTSEELLAVLAKARTRRLRDWVMLLFLYWHGYRVSELVRSSTKQLGLFFTRAKADQRVSEFPGATVQEVVRKVKGKPRPCYLVTAPAAVEKPGLTLDAIEGDEITVQRLKGSMRTTQYLQEHDNPLLDEKRAWSEWMAERPLLGKKGGKKMTQKDVLSHFDESGRVFNLSRRQVHRLYQRYAIEAGLPRRKRHPHCLKHTIGTDLVESGLPLPKVQVHLGHKSLASTGKYTLPKEAEVSRAVGKAIRSKAELRQFQQGTLF